MPEQKQGRDGLQAVRSTELFYSSYATAGEDETTVSENLNWELP